MSNPFSRLQTLADERGNADLAAAALEISQLFQPGLEPQRWLQALDDHAAVVGKRFPCTAPVSEKVRALGAYLFDELGFSGDRDEYAAARNSFLDQVLQRRRGLPITLSVLYVALARRLGLQAAGIGFPSHFLVLVHDAKGQRVLDPFGGGRWLSVEDLNARLKGLYGEGAPTVEAEPGLLRPATTREILVRMLRNLKALYQEQGDALNSLVAIEAILSLEPDLIEEIGDRALAYRDLGHSSAAAEDLRRYLAATEDAREAVRMQGLLEELERAPTRLH